jgi:hypothetical protein
VVDVLAVYRPGLPVACMSGFASQVSGGRRLLVPFIPKPFDAEGLRALLEPLRAEAIDLVAAGHELRRRRSDQPPAR